MHPPNPKESEALAKVAHEVAQRSSKILGEFVQKQAESMSSAVRDEMGIAKAFMDLYARMAADPALMATVSMNLWLDYMRLWQSSWMKLFGIDVGPVARGDAGTVAAHVEHIGAVSALARDAYVALGRLTADRALTAGLLDAARAEALLEALATNDSTDPPGGGTHR